jgi:ubiquinone/menaquinone biosynthesis C-methylase UbiE
MGIDKWCRYEFAAGQISKDAQVVDVGGGSGDFFRHMNVEGIVADKYVDSSRIARNRVQCQFVRFDGKRLPFQDSSVPVIISLDVLEHLPPSDRGRFLAELRRVSGAKVVMSFPSDIQHFIRPLLAISRFHRIMGVRNVAEANLMEHMACGLPKSAEVISDFEKCGWKVEASQEFGLFHSLFMICQWTMPFLAFKSVNILVSRLTKKGRRRKPSYLYLVAHKDSIRESVGFQMR